jgi:alkaline phosphatase
MKILLSILLLILSGAASSQLIHAHNDYEKHEPLINALHNKAFTIEADVYPGDSLFVAHDKKDITADKTLVSMYLQPIIQMFAAHHGYISSDTAYAPNLMIDIKEHSELVIPQLIKLLAPYRNVFDGTVNNHAVQIVLSGDRGNINNWNNYPSYILFDGRPYENYDSNALVRVAFISDSYMNYINLKDSIDYKLQELAIATHKRGKLLRLWAIPDNEIYWNKLRTMGVDIINTDKIEECRKYFYTKP